MFTTYNNINRLIGAGVAAAALLLASPAFSQSLSVGTSGSAGLSGIKGAPGAASGGAAVDLDTRTNTGVGARVGTGANIGAGSTSTTGNSSASGNVSTNIERVTPDVTIRNNTGVSQAGVRAAQEQAVGIQGSEPSGGNE